MQENRIETIKEGDFEGLRNLDSLILAHNKLRQIPANVFSHLRLLNSLELEGNYITYIDKDAFSGLEGELKFDLFQQKPNSKRESLRIRKVFILKKVYFY